jgi:hypothetical protein
MTEAMETWSLFRKIKAALDSEDIEGLLAIGCPTDEYDGEASLIESKLATASNFGKMPFQLDEVERSVAEVWDDQFGPFAKEDLERRRSAFSSVAKKIIA